MIWLIGFGGSIGASVRYLLAGYLNKKSKQLPLGTWTVNILGSFVLGMLAQYHLSHGISDGLWFFLGVGFCGAFTTFSTFGFETITFLQTKRINSAVMYVLASVLISIAASAIGFYLVK